MVDFSFLKKRGIVFTVIVAIIIILLLLGFVNFIYKKNCKDLGCFNNALYNCDKAIYTSDSDSAVWAYTIKGKSGDSCIVNSKLLQLKQGNVEILKLEGEDMDCYLPFQSITTPSKDIDLCHGILKEEMQKIIIKRLQNLVENMGKITEEVGTVI
jgi:hypothetical protein